MAKSYSSGSLSETRHYYHSNKWQVLEERVDSSTDADRQHVWGTRYIDDLILRDRDTNSDGTLDERLFALQDDNWNVVALSDDSGNVVERYAYSAYGRPEVYDASFSTRSTSSYDWETLYAGYRYDDETGLHCVRHRYLNPALGVWVSRDPIGQNSVGIYAYASLSPTTRIDPS